MARGKKLSNDVCEVIYRVYLYCTIEAEKFETENGYFQKVRYRVSQATGISKRTICRLVQEKGKPGSEAFKKRLEEAIKRSSENYDSLEECAPKISKSGVQNHTDSEDESVSDMDIHQVSNFTTQKKEYVKSVPVQAGPAVIKVQEIQKILNIEEPLSIEPQLKPAVTIMKALPIQRKPDTLLSPPTLVNKRKPEVILVKALNSSSNSPHTSGTASSAVVLKPHRTIIQVHRKRQDDNEIKTIHNNENIVLQPIMAPEFVKIETQGTPEDLNTMTVTNTEVTDDIKMEIKTEIDIDECDLK